MDQSPRLNRRGALSLVAITAAGGALMCQTAFAQETGAATPIGLMPGADVCVITPEVTEGPYYFDPALERADITEGRPGVKTLVRLQVVDAMCKPLEGARVDIWHCDATGLYSNYPGQGEDRQTDTTGTTFMRGTLFTGANGIAEFTSVYPGWYRGRTTHVHFKVFIDQTNILTGQIFFPDALSEYLYLNVAPYNERSAARDTLNSTDGIAAQATRASFAYIKELADRYLAAMIIGVDPNAKSSDTGMPGGPPPGGPPPGGKPNGPPPGGAAGATGNIVPGVTTK